MNMEFFSSAEDDILIRLVARFPFIYDPNDSQYRDPFKRLKVWDTIGKLVNKSGKSCKNRWKNIKDTYLRQKRKLESGLAMAGHHKSKFEEYKIKLSFLDVAVKGQATHCISPSNSDDIERLVLEINDDSFGSPEAPNQGSPEPESDFMIIPEMASDSENASDNLRITEVKSIDGDQWDFAGYKSKETPKQQYSNKRTLQSRKKQMMMQKYLQRRESRQKLMQKNTSQSNTVDEDDEINLFSRQASSILRKLPSHHQIKAMQEMFGILTKYKMLATEPGCSCSKSTEAVPDEVDPLIKTEYIPF